MARDRQRAKQRKARRAQSRGPARSQPYRSDLPGELEHASGEVDEFEAELVAGAHGKTLDDEPDVRDEADEVDEPDEPAIAAHDEDDRSALTAPAAADDEPSALVTRPGDEDDEDSPEELDDEAFDELEDDVDDATLEREAVTSAPGPRRPPDQSRCP